MEPTLRALLDAGGTCTNQEFLSRVSSLLELTHEQASLGHGRGDRRTEIEYRLAWARTKLRAAGLIEPAGRATWSLTAAGRARAQGSHA
ncbi:MAG: winged helix-turn-helix domain-containing protein [Nannocystaceae bacterium]